MNNAREVGGDVYQPLDAEEEDISVHEGDLTREEEDVDPDGNLLGPLPEEEAAMQAAMRAGDEAAALALARWQELRAEGKVVDYGTQTTSPSASYQGDEDVYDLVEDEVPPPPKRVKGVESSRAAEERALATIPLPQLRRVRPEPADEEVVGDTANPLDEWPTLGQYVLVQQWCCNLLRKTYRRKRSTNWTDRRGRPDRSRPFYRTLDRWSQRSDRWSQRSRPMVTAVTMCLGEGQC